MDTEGVEERPADELPGSAGLYEFDRSRRYVLAERDDRYGIWEIGREFAPPVASFPMDDEEAFELAVEEFARLNKADRKAQRFWITLIWWVALISAPVWIATSAATTYLQLSNSFDIFGRIEGVYQALSVARAVCYGLLHASVLVLVATYVHRRLRNEI